MSIENEFAFRKENYLFLIGGVIMVVGGFIMMLGGGSDDPNAFNKEELFSTTRITLAPLMVLAGFVGVLYGIMKKPKAE